MTTTYTLDDEEAPSDGVYAAVAAVDDRSPLDLPPLARTVDPDALDALLADESGTREITFEYAEYLVTAAPDEIEVAPDEE